MEFSAKLKDVQADYMENKVVISFETSNMQILNDVSKLKETELSVKAEKYHKKRSLDANGYLWVLCTKIAEVLKSSKDEVYEDVLQKYGCCYEDDNGYVTITVKSCVDMSRIDGHWKFYRESKDGKFKSYLMIKGTSQYNIKEMANFLDMVVEDAKELGIETMPPNELERLVRAWKG